MAVYQAYGDSRTFFRTKVGQGSFEEMSDQDLSAMEYSAQSSSDPQVRTNGDNARIELRRRQRGKIGA